MKGDEYDEPYDENNGCMIVSIILVTLCYFLWPVSCSAQTPYQIDSTINAVLKCRDVPPFTRRLLVAQARVESGNYTNNLYKRHCNLWSMRHPKKRNTTSCGPYARAEKRNGYASFNSVESSTEDIVLYFANKRQPMRFTSTAGYVRWLKKKRFFEDTEARYLNMMRKQMLYLKKHPME